MQAFAVMKKSSACTSASGIDTPVGDSTEISSTAIFFGMQTQQLPGEGGDLMQQFTRRFYTDFKAACEKSWREEINA
jgi:hypothetical protein